MNWCYRYMLPEEYVSSSKSCSTLLLIFLHIVKRRHLFLLILKEHSHTSVGFDKDQMEVILELHGKSSLVLEMSSRILSWVLLTETLGSWINTTQTPRHWCMCDNFLLWFFFFLLVCLFVLNVAIAVVWHGLLKTYFIYSNYKYQHMNPSPRLRYKIFHIPLKSLIYLCLITSPLFPPFLSVT